MKNRKATYQIDCEGVFEFSEELSIDGSGSLADRIDAQFDELFDSLWDDDVFYDGTEEAMERYKPETKGVFSVHDVTKQFYKKAHEFIDSLDEKFHLSASEILPSGELGEPIQLDSNLVLKRIHERWEEREISEQSNCDAGDVIEKSIMLFEREGSWHAGYIPSDSSAKEALIPAIWFGMKDDQPSASLWTLSENTTEEELAFWHSSDEWEVMAAIIGEDDQEFLTWYICECGSNSPDINRIREQCPICTNLMRHL